ncbi:MULTISPECIES: hypothetical protein [Bacillaceae]|uniref:Uncharacterized protein n=1 Tax=Caldibacillus thermoamylovorans TaxID=35841 RepID=A0A090IVB8_9BACI|nr:hypothetical protein [Caldibacillus thermoamylovorans]MCM3478312.1 hypothetical protein [Caldibacillus thermoamylovorans]CEE02036.1 hypothetical protein BT1A1_2215 [Caldibacillus thermoamylovorans]
MDILIFVLMAIAIILIVVSFFLPDRTKELSNEVEQLSIQMYQENFQIKKRLKILEEELLIPGDMDKNPSQAKNPNPIIVGQVRLLHEQGLTVEQIAKQSALSEDEVKQILETIKVVKQ